MVAIEATRGVRRYGERERAVAGGHPEQLALGDAPARADHPVVRGAGARHEGSIAVHGDGPAGIVEGGVEARHVVGLGVHGLVPRVARTHFQAQVAGDAPVVGDEALHLPEAEEAHRVRLGLGIGAEVAEQSVREGVARGARVAAGVEPHVSRVDRAPVLVLAVPDEQAAGLEAVRALEPGQVVAELDVRGGRDQRSFRAEHRRVAIHPSVRDAVLEPSPAGEELRERESVALALPGVTGGRDPLAVPGRVGLELVDEVRGHRPVVGYLIVAARPPTDGRDGRKRVRVGDEGPEGVDQVVAVVDDAQGQPMVRRRLVV